MKITRLDAQNFKRLCAVSISPDGHVVQITGRNANGKSSVLDAIEAAMGGRDHAPVEPVRAGEDRARIVCTLDGGALVVRRTFTAAGGGSLVVENAEGARFGSPQAVLDKLVGTLTFDPLAFVRLPPKAQLDTLRRLVGLDFAEEDRRRTELFAERTGVNRAVAQLKAQRGSDVVDPNLPAAELSLGELLAKVQQADAANAKHDNALRLSAEKRNRVNVVRAASEKARPLLAAAEADLALAAEAESTFSARLLDLPPKVDTKPLRESIAGAEALNARIRDQHRLTELGDQLAKAEAEAMRLTNAMTAIDAAQRERTQAAAFPVGGLALTHDGVRLNGLPFGQASSAEQVRASAAIGLAMNPKLRVLLVRDGSLLDTEGMAMLAEFAEANDAQVWVERVTDGESVGVVIEDGMVDGGPNPYDEADALPTGGGPLPEPR